MIKRIRFKMAGTLLTIASMAIMVALIAGCTHDPRTIRIDHVGAKEFDATAKRIIVQKPEVSECLKKL